MKLRRSSAVLTGGAATALLAAAAAALGACGNEPTRPPTVARTALGGPERVGAFPSAGVGIGIPQGWIATAGAPPLLITLRSGSATVAVWRYPRTQALPATVGAASGVVQPLLGAVRARDPSFRLDSVRALTLDGHPAVQVVGLETVAGGARRVRSVHLYAFGAEIVMDEYAPADEFTRVNKASFVPILHSLAIRRPA